MLNPFQRYARLNRDVKNLIFGEALLQVMNGAYFLISNLYLSEEGYTDQEIADFIFYRFLGVLFLAMPFGMFIKTKRLIPFLYIGGIAMVLSSLTVLYGIDTNQTNLAKGALLVWGIGFMLVEVVKLPFIMRYCNQEEQSSAIALSFSTWSLGALIAGLFSVVLSSINAAFFDARNVIGFISLFSILSLIFFLRIRTKESIPKDTKSGFLMRDYDWKRITKAVFPTLVIAVGAGLTVPFINLFFEKVHGINFKEFSQIGAIAYGCVFAMVLFAPGIKDRFGFQRAIPTTQTLAVLALIGLACTEWFPKTGWALALAFFFFILRQPLMALAQPLTSELVLNYVGQKNQELISAFQSTIWNGAFVFSSTMFGLMRAWEIPFVYIFLMTAALYLFAIFLYILLIRAHQREEQLTK